MLRIAIIVGSTRPGRRGRVIGEWAYEIARKRGDAEFELVDLADFHLPLLDEPEQASQAKRNYTKPHTRAWSEKIDSFDGFLFVVAEYNHGPTAALKNAIDCLYPEWNNKAAGFISYGGSTGGGRAVEQLRPVMAALQIADVSAQVLIALRSEWKDGAVHAASHQEPALHALLDQVVAWGTALAPLRKTQDHP
jgi:NAD(P)H-dependent FMN reductase